MSLVDQFTSVFRSADRRQYRYEGLVLAKVLVVTDLAPEEAAAWTADVRRFLVEIDGAEWTTLTNEDYGDVDALSARVAEIAPDLIVTYRNVRYSTWRWPYSLGVYLNVLTRETSYPVLVMPNPHELPDLRFGERETKAVMVLADALTGDDRLVNYGVRFVRPEGVLYLAHVEDDAVFDRYMDAIGKIPSIDTDVAREDIKERLLKDPTDYVESCRAELETQGHLTHAVVPLVRMGHRRSDYVELIESHEVDLLVFHAKEQEDLALHGAAYSLAVLLRELPILML